MGVYIKGMEMPKSCRKCFIKQGSCPAIRKRIQVLPKNNHIWVPYNYRYDDCPIVEVPPHGRLVDESWLKKAMITTLEVLKKNPKMDGQEMHLIAAFDTLRAMVEDAPTVIEAEEGD